MLAQREIINGPTGEDLKAVLVKIDPNRSKDALSGLKTADFQVVVDRSTVGPYNGELKGSGPRDFLSNPHTVMVIGTGRDEHKRGNLGPNLRYMQESTQYAGNVVYIDGNSTDGSVEVAREYGVKAVERRLVLDNFVNKTRLAEVLAMNPQVFETYEAIDDSPPLRKGTDVMVARIMLLHEKLQGRAPRYAIYTDTDLGSIPEGQYVKVKGKELRPEQIYHPLELLAQGTIDLNAKRTDGSTQAAVYTGSERRNNEPVFAEYNRLGVAAKDPFLSDRQREIAQALFLSGASIIHPLTGELIVETEAELEAMGATGQCVETARTLSLAWRELDVHGLPTEASLDSHVLLSGNVRRGKQQRIDEPQIDRKEDWMITGVIPQFLSVVTTYAIRTGRTPSSFTLDDYRNMNEWLSRINHTSQLDNETQTRDVVHYPMERIIPPVTLLHQEGIIHF